MQKMTNKEFAEKILAQKVRKDELPVKLLTKRQASKFRRKQGELYHKLILREV